MARIAATLLLAAALAFAHGDHGENVDPAAGFAERHMAAEHHIDSFDLPAFFKLHDLNMDGVWDRDEIAAIYGLRHHSVTGRKSNHYVPADLENKIVAAVLEKLDKDGDGKVSMDEYVSAGPNSLPVFSEHKDLGHHYDEESEYFLHHEELYHNTPETQTDESYTHPEDIEHFKHHARIEAEEDARQRIFEGLPPNADLSEDHKAPEDPLAHHEHAENEGPAAVAENGEVIPEESRAERAARAARRAQPNRIVVDQSTEATSRHRHRHNPEERLRPDAPYKYKYESTRMIQKSLTGRMRGGLRADEF